MPLKNDQSSQNELGSHAQMLTGKTALITGASRGIGRAIAIDLAANGANVVINYRSDETSADRVVAHIVAAGGEAIAIQADVCDSAQVQGLVAATVGKFGRIDILVNNAGTTRDGLLLRMQDDDWDALMAVNVKGVFNCCKAALRPMLKQRDGGRIINITSLAGLVGNAGQTNYAASKAAIHGFTKSLAKEVGSRGITVNAVAPGLFQTDLTAHLPQKTLQLVAERAPLGRLGALEEVAYLVSFLASDNAAYITGEIIRIDGGLGIGG
jgi:3-oxoacyl-[acyl-carrier protein] reductase